jgi:hypothetical protein
VLGGDMNTGLAGGDGGAPFLDMCPEGQVVIGYNGSLNSTSLGINGVPITVIGSLQTVCGTLSLDNDAASFVTIKQGATLESRPAPSTNPWSSVCPENKVVIGVTGYFGDALDKFSIQCTQLRITKSPTGDVVSPDMSTIQVLGPNGGDAGSMMYSEVCPEGTMAQGSNIRSMTSWVVAFGLVCGSPSVVTVDAGAPCCTSTSQQTLVRAVDEPPLP